MCLLMCTINTPVKMYAVQSILGGYTGGWFGRLLYRGVLLLIQSGSTSCNKTLVIVILK